jgi:hypothetical protein
MNLIIVLGSLAFLMFVAYRGCRMILFAPVTAMGAFWSPSQAWLRRCCRALRNAGISASPGATLVLHQLRHHSCCARDQSTLT